MGSVIKLRLLRLRDDFWAYLLMTVMAFGLTVVFGVSFNEYAPTVLIVDENNSSYSKVLSEELRESNVFHFQNSDRKQATTKVEEGEVLAAILIEDHFESDIKEGNSVSLGIMKLKQDTLLLTLNEQLSSAVLKISDGVRISDITADYIVSIKPGADRQVIKAKAYSSIMDAWKYKNPMSLKAIEEGSNKENSYDSLKHSMIGFSLFFSMYAMVFGVGTILYDKQHRTWQRMLITPISRTSILGGSMIVAYLTGALQLGILIIGGKYLLKIDWGNSIGGVLLVAAAFVFAVTAMGLLLSGIVKTHMQLSSITPVVLISTSMLGGCMWPLDIVNNKILLFLAELTPQKWAMQGMEGIASRGMGFEAAVLPTSVLIGMGIIFFGFGVKLMKFESV